MRRYIPLIPALLVMIYSLIAITDEGFVSFVSILVMNTAVSLYGGWLLLRYISFLSGKRTDYILVGMTINLVPIDHSIYRYVNILSFIAMVMMVAIGQWFLTPLFGCWGCWQNLMRKDILSSQKQEKQST